MAVKVVDVRGVGPVIVSKRKRAKHIRLSLDSRGRVRLSIPHYIPTSAGLLFLSSKKNWLEKQINKHSYFRIADNVPIGKNFRLRIHNNNHKPGTRTSLSGNNLFVYNLDDSPNSQRLAENAIIRCLKIDAQALLLPRLRHLAQKNNYRYKTASVKVLRSRWGSCSSSKNIALSVFLVQLPWQLIDYVLLHELAHTKYLSHDQKFWQEVELKVPDYKNRRRELRNFRPTIINHSP